MADARQATEVLPSISAESREEVDEMAKKAADAGGAIFSEPQENQGWMYSCAFADLDGYLSSFTTLLMQVDYIKL